MPFPEGITTRQDGLGEQYPFLVGEVATEEGQHLDPAYLSDFQSGFIQFDAFLLSFTVTAAEPEPDEPCCPEVPELDPSAPCPPETTYMGSPCHAPDCIQQWEDGPTMWDGGRSWWECEEGSSCSPEVEMVALEILGDWVPGADHPPIPIVSAHDAEDTTSLLVAVTTTEAATYNDFTVPPEWVNALNPDNHWAGKVTMMPGFGDLLMVAWQLAGELPGDPLTSNYGGLQASFMLVTVRLQPGQRLVDLLYAPVANTGSPAALPPGLLSASGQLTVATIPEMGPANHE